ncbi:MAG TPA: hypothetical protein PKH54_05040 [Myxococcota bacterium]|nr:hypothetical protein [Myxococcota bacterium]HOA13929.1 hypothetical protein [Myxococcota bacterium]HOC99289.1 hypothetical protein [Myxococcota bacterium]HOH76676.1 hypothetical protein [Myxococcota bacterium]HPV05020.1 hypothetical protein [Myxococcota bacterium]
MAVKEYQFNHPYDAQTAMDKIRPLLGKWSGAYKLDMEQTSPTQYTLSTTGVQAEINIADNKATAVVEMNMMMEMMFRGKIEEALEQKLRPAIEKM